jgi:hypothetical protein
MPEKAEPKAHDKRKKQAKQKEAPKLSDLDPMNENHCLTRYKISDTEHIASPFV